MEELLGLGQNMAETDCAYSFCLFSDHDQKQRESYSWLLPATGDKLPMLGGMGHGYSGKRW